MSLTVHPDKVRDVALVVDVLENDPQVSLITSRGVRVALPTGLRQVLDAAAQALLGGREVIVGSTDTFVTTQQAADFLGVSRPTMVRILDLGELPCDRPASHRRIRLTDLVDYKQKAASRRASLDRLLDTSDDMAEFDGGFAVTR